MLFGKDRSKEDFFDMFTQAGQNLVTAAGYLQQIVNAPQAVAEQLVEEDPGAVAELPSNKNMTTLAAEEHELPVDPKLVRKDRKHYQQLLHDIEHQNDELTHRVANLLDATFVTPMDRDDIRVLAGALDDCMDYLDEAGDMIVLYRLGDIPRRLTKQVDILEQCAKLTAQAMPKLRKKENLKDYTVEINDLENKGDKAYRKMLVEIFESDIDPILVIKIKDVLESLEAACDSFEHLANVVETIYIKES